MPDFESIKLSLDSNVLTLTIDRPDALNSLNVKTVNEIREAIAEAVINKDVKGLIITGRGDKAFVAGADVNEIKDLNEVNSRKFAENGQEVFASIENCEKPIIAAVNGYALGGGCELAMACHLRVASENARFGQPEVKLGIIPGYGGTQRLTHLVGKGKAMELLMTGDTISAKEALDLGLVNYVVPPDELSNTVNKVLSNILKQAPMAVANVVNCVNAAFDGEANGYQIEANNFMNCCRTEDFKEGTTAFLEKREPAFKGE